VVEIRRTGRIGVSVQARAVIGLSAKMKNASDGDFLSDRGGRCAEADGSRCGGRDRRGRYERSDDGTTWRNGFHDRVLDIRLGALQLGLPKFRQASHFPSFLEAPKTSEKALIAVIHQAWIGGVSTRR